MVQALDARDYTEPYLQIYTRVPSPGDGVCPVCHSGPNPGFSMCYSCSNTLAQVSRPISLIVPISLYEVPGQLHHWLRSYKDGPTQEVRDQLGTHVSATLARFLSGHLNCISQSIGHSPTLATTVPSSSQRPGKHPLETAVERLLLLQPIYRQALTSTGTVQLDHNRASDQAFETVVDVTGHHILLIEDTLTSAARMMSAGSALLGAGAASVAGVVIGRVIKPAWNDNCKRIWDNSRAAGFTFDACCLEA